MREIWNCEVVMLLQLHTEYSGLCTSDSCLNDLIRKLNIEILTRNFKVNWLWLWWHMHGMITETWYKCSDACMQMHNEYDKVCWDFWERLEKTAVEFEIFFYNIYKPCNTSISHICSSWIRCSLFSYLLFPRNVWE